MTLRLTDGRSQDIVAPVPARSRARGRFGLLAGALLVTGPALAQTASQITPQSFRPALQSQGGGLVIPEGPGLEAPAGAERLTVRLRTVAIEGTLPDLADPTQDIVAGLSGRTVTAAELFAAARALEQAYVAAGYPLVRVVLPAQRLADGADLRLVVLDGFVERVDTDALPPEIRARVAAVLAPLAGARALRLSELERRLLLAGDAPGTVLRSTLAPGSVPGGVVLVVEARTKPVTGSAGIDNTLSDALGRTTSSFGLDLNSPTGTGELLYLRAGGAPYPGGRASFFDPEPRNRSLAAGLVLPLGADGLTLNLEVTDARTTPKAQAGTLGFTSDFSRYSARLRYPLIRSRAFTLNAEAAFDAQEERQTVIVPVEAPFSLDRLRIARTTTDFLWFLPSDGIVSGRLSGAFGLDGLGARRPPGAGAEVEPLSRLGARPEFQKLEATLSVTQPVAEHLTLDLRARGQTSFNQALPRSEQIGLANLTGLSSFDAGLFQGDEGYVVRGEVQLPFVLPVSLPFRLFEWPGQLGTGLASGEETLGAVMASPYGFGAFGMVRLQRPTALERAMVRGASYGVGIRFGASPQASFTNVSASVEYGRSERSDRLPADDRITFSVALQF
ncbi:ShlB/FhaC/HecB family hemolysin secretion/activation protein [Methylobacterium nonmethylotrophicum]|uniref:ShlB/FhaC/HecB family hemolysin secretion/activation protein n=1 Tax=Methylobacterium nonmethylotrophicum TaxID=1141884 RepID=A0A4Z0NUY0_9HYPH|nr:ShlB/FhaC/HecB family hemolysin secretion/activation protein [Methylobacterium nonmethylotrophicum]TGE00512.1 ShlB/FhaC/HecB family hemolysin secretion/activation protein [Methylobacterium nonmethylotrophicum]